MTNIEAYSFHRYISGRMLERGIIYQVILIFLLLSFQGESIFAQDEPEYDEISVFLDVPRLGAGEINAVIKGEVIYLPVTDLFDFLKIRNIPSQGLENISGFFISPEAPYRIDRITNIISYEDKEFILDPESLIRTETNLYLRGDYFGKIFGLDCIFSFRNLSVQINTRLELPVMREMRLEEMRTNLTRLKGEIKADTTIGRKYPLFHFGMADWSFIATEQIKGKSETRLNLSLGAIVAGGETTVSLNYNSQDPFTEKQQYYLWRYVNNDNKLLRQVRAGKIAAGATSSIYNPVVGVQFTNTPTTFRRSFGSYTLSDKTEPGWIVELYVNNILVNYVKADASGFFTFEVPLVYGNSNIIMKFYGPWGEERTREQNITIPFNFIPKNTLEYTISAGLVEDSLFSRFSRTSFNYGLSRGITVGAGYEYLSSVLSGPMMPYVNASFRLASNLLLSGEYTNSVRAKGSLSYRLPSNLQIDLNYTRYDKNQKAINYNYLEERKAVVSIPWRMKNFMLYNRISVSELVLPTIDYITGEWLVSGSLFGVNTNITTYALFIGKNTPYSYSNIALSLRFPAGFTIIPQAQYGYTDKELLTAKVGVEKRFLKNAYLNLSYEQNFRSNIRMGEIGFRYDFKFAQTGVSTRQTERITTFIQYARGSLINDRKSNYLGTDNRANVGRGGITIIPYLDINANAKRDQGEPTVGGLNIRSSGGRIERNDRDSTIRILGIEPYTDCIIELDQESFENISWRLKDKTIKVAVDPNMLKLIEVPVTVMGEASGSIIIDKNGEISALARMIVNFYSKKNIYIGRTLSEEDGYFSYFGLVPGEYKVKVDTGQLGRLDMLSLPDSINFNITANEEGDFIDGLDFTIMTIAAEEDTIKETRVPVLKKDTTYLVVHEITQELITISEDSYAIQLGAFRNKSNAELMRRRLEKLLGRKVEIIIEDDYFKVRINEIKERTEVDEIIVKLHKEGITELWVISLKAKRQQLVLVEKQDTIRQIMEFPVFGPDFYKLKIGGVPVIDQTVLEEMKRLRPVEKLKISEIWKVPVISSGEEELEEEKEEVLVRTFISLDKIKISIAIPPFYKHDTLKLAGTKIKVPEAQSQPTIALQVAVFQKESQALQAKRKIMSKLKLPVEIITQWDSYHVIITGFYTREETYMYYPELAGMGYPGVRLIENYIRQE